MYNDRQIELIDRLTGKVQPWMIEARQRGVLFDAGHGAGSFLWPVATRAVEQGFVPDTISTDRDADSFAIQQSDMPNVMSKMMLLGMSFPDARVRSTVNPAREIGRYPESGDVSAWGAWPISRCWRSNQECSCLRIRGRPSGWERSGWSAC